MSDDLDIAVSDVILDRSCIGLREKWLSTIGQCATWKRSLFAESWTFNLEITKMTLSIVQIFLLYAACMPRRSQTSLSVSGIDEMAGPKTEVWSEVTSWMTALASMKMITSMLAGYYKETSRKQEGSRDLQKRVPFSDEGGFVFSKPPFKGALHEGLKGAWKGLEGGFKGGFKGAWRGLEGGFKGAWRGLEAFNALFRGGLKGASSGLEGGFKGVWPWRGLKGGFKGAWSLQRWRGLQERPLKVTLSRPLKVPLSLPLRWP